MRTSYVNVGIPDDHPLLGLVMFNNEMRSASPGYDLLTARMRALLAMAKDGRALKSLAEHFKSRMPHWTFLNGNDYATCKYVVHRLSSSENDEYRQPWGEKFIRVQVHARQHKTATVSVSYKRRTGECRIHPDKVDKARGLCNTCYIRSSRLTKMGMISYKTDATVLDAILRLPVHRGGKSTFARDARRIIEGKE